MQLLRVITLAGVVSIALAGKQFTCPNSGEPKRGNDGNVIQCLPGQASDVVCGRGYSCFFSGFNYQCCPTADEDYDISYESECPLGSISVLNSHGSPLRCNPRTGQCPDNLFCSRQNAQAICCESLTKKTTTTQVPSTQRRSTITPPRKIQIKAIEQTLAEVPVMECPSQALTVLGDTGEPIECSSQKQCPSQSMFCHTAGSQSICCESLETAGDNLEVVPTTPGAPASEEGAFNPLKYSPRKIEDLNEEQQIQKEIESAVVENAPHKAKKSRKFADSDNTIRFALPAVHDAPATTTAKPDVSHASNRRPHIIDNQIRTHRLHGVKNTNPEDIEYKPSQSGGYAVSSKLDKINARGPATPNRKAVAQQFIVDQIKQGWPYDDKFYRPENIAVIRNGARTEAVVHFPN